MDARKHTKQAKYHIKITKQENTNPPNISVMGNEEGSLTYSTPQDQYTRLALSCVLLGLANNKFTHIHQGYITNAGTSANEAALKNMGNLTQSL